MLLLRKLLCPTLSSLSLIFFHIGCGSQGVENNANVQHAWGQTHRGDIPSLSPERCIDDFYKSPASARLVALAQKIAVANRETFQNNLDLLHLCIGVNPNLPGVDAHSTPESLRIEFSNQMLLTAGRDGELAAILSHELAHLSLQHRGFGETPPVMDSDVQFSSWKAESKAIQDSIATLATQRARPEQIFALIEKFSSILAKMNQRIDEVYGERDAHRNWMEQEADEVGSEFFIRAGFDRMDYINILWKTRHDDDSQDRSDCQKMIENSEGNSSPLGRPERGQKSHPTMCWRVFHLTIDEWLHSHRNRISSMNVD